VSSAQRDVNAILLLYHRSAFVTDAATITDHIRAFGTYSSFPVQPVNTDAGFPRSLADHSFDAIVAHYSLFASGPFDYFLDAGFREFLAGAERSYKVAFFQDEHEYCRRRFSFLDDYGFDCVYTCFSPDQFAATYGTYTRVPKLVSHVPAYVSPEMVAIAERLHVPDSERRVDVGYRARPTPPYFGRGGMEKVEIAERFLEHAAGSGLELDISIRERDRLYGDDWYRFLAASRGVLGSESGASCVDLEDEVREEYLRLEAAGEEPTIERLEQGALGRWDWKVPLRTTASRHFEAAALRVCPVMYEGGYSGTLRPMEHFIPLKKDFSNFDEAVERFRDPSVRRELTENAHRDLIASGEYSYERFFAGFDEVLREAGLRPPAEAGELVPIRGRRATGILYRYAAGASLWLRRRAPGLWSVIRRILDPIVRGYRRLRRPAGAGP
jgi:hypothetical protein